VYGVLKLDVIGKIVKGDFCVGCGICAAICPQKNLEIRDNKYGEYVPYKTHECDFICGLCLEVCPFSSHQNETQIGEKLYGSIEGIKYLSETGYYLGSYVGYSHKFRNKGASGGITTWILTKLINKNVVDYIICVTPQENSSKLFDFEIFNDEDSIIKSSGSAYYPVEMSQVIQKVLDTPGRYAITGLPCFLKALRLAAQKNKILRERIRVTVGLTCGQLKNKQYTVYLSTLAKVKGELKKVSYRGKSPENTANNYFFHCINEKEEEGRVFFNEAYLPWSNRWFTLKACNFCDDIFAELADITLMDAWLPEYSHDYRGTNLFIVRSPLIKKILNEGSGEEEIDINTVSINKIIQSQLGVIEIKRKQLPYRVHLEKKKGVNVPVKRFDYDKRLEFFKKREIELKNKMQKRSKEYFIENYCNYEFDIKKFKRKMNLEIKGITLINTIKIITSNKYISIMKKKSLANK
jgi:coenzyme F420 hydrogenase subunit beta